MKAARIACLLRSSAICLATLSAQAHAAYGDDSFNPNPDKFDEDRAAQFDSFYFISHVVTRNHSRYQQNFESGFTTGQQISGWMPVGGVKMRIGFGNSLGSINWNSEIGGIDATSSTYGLHHPHGTYGNAPGVVSPARNYVNDLQFLTYDSSITQTPPSYVVMQFDSPIYHLSFGITDYADSTGGNAHLSLWSGSDLQELVEIPTNNPANSRDIPPGAPAGDFQYFVGSSRLQQQAFNYAILRLDATDSTIGFDNFIIGAAPIPEPETYAMFLTGLGLLGAAARKRRI